MLLTLADGQGTSDERLERLEGIAGLATLSGHAARYLADGEAGYSGGHASEREGQHKAVAAELDCSFTEEIDAHFHWMPERYFKTYDASLIAEHLRLQREFLRHRYDHDGVEAALAPVIRWTHQPDRGHTECWVCTWERRGLFAKIAGSFAAAGLNILSADIYTRGDNIALDVFRVCDTSLNAATDPRDLSAVESVLRQALLTDRFDFEPLLQKARRRRRLPKPLLQQIDFPTRTVITNEATNLYTLVEIQTPDRLGLLYELLRALGKLGINVILSRIATEKGAAVDSFYITAAAGERITDPTMMRKIQAALQQAAVKGV